MAQATATCTCKYCGGTFYRIKDCPSRKSADDWEEWAANNITVCNTCAAKHRREKHDQENAAAAHESEAMGLPKLTGSAKQIAWAETIRIHFLRQINSQREMITDKLKNPETADRAKKILQNIDETTNLLLSHDAASWWIDRRGYNCRDLIRLAKCEEKEEK